jgi:uncharacterized protein YgbK (DUF1537 family)
MTTPISRPTVAPVQAAPGEEPALNLPVSLPPRRQEPDALRKIHAHNASTRRWIVIIDDDPTGCQAMYDATVLIDPTTDELARAAREQRATFVWTNTRSLSEAQAVDVNRTIVRLAIEAAGIAGTRPVFVSRSDSTLRGHFAAEVSAIADTCWTVGRPVDGVVFAPAFLEAGRVTAGDIQWVVRADGHAVPAAHTEFARDATFGYREVNLRDWVAARTSISPEKITSIPLDALRTPGAATAEKILLSLRDGDITIANAATASDLETLALACQAAERAGRHLLYRTGPSLVRALAGQPPRPALSAVDLAGHGAGIGGLTVVGSHTALTTRQLEAAARRHPLRVVGLDVDAVLDVKRRATVRCQVADELERALQRGDAALVTSRAVRAAVDDPRGSLAIARLVSEEVCAVVGQLSADLPLRYVVAKGGITSHEVAVRGLGMRRATVLGQMFPGQVSALRLGPETPRPGMPYVVFPGNVGHDDSLAQVLTTLAGAATCC